MTRRDLTLKEALLTLVDERLWMPLRERVGSAEDPISLEKAWDLMIRSSPDDGIFQFFRISVEERALNDDDKLLIFAYNVARNIIGDLEQKIQCHQIIVSGINPLGQRVTIDDALCDELQIRVQERAAEGQGWKFTHLRLSQAPVVAIPPTVCERWLRDQQAAFATVPKKVLIEEARAALGDGLTDRVFNQAYLDVFERGRGRPRKPRE